MTRKCPYCTLGTHDDSVACVGVTEGTTDRNIVPVEERYDIDIVG